MWKIFLIGFCAFAFAAVVADNDTSTISIGTTDTTEQITSTITPEVPTTSSKVSTEITTEAEATTKTGSVTPTTNEDTTVTNVSPTITTQTSAPPTPAPSPVPKLEDVSFTLSENNVTCLTVTLALELQIFYQKKDKTNGTTVIYLPKTATITSDSNCNITGTEQVLGLTWDNFNLTFTFLKYDATTSLKNLVFYYVLDDNFPNATYPGSKLNTSLESGNIFNTSVNSKYKCDAEQTFNLNSGKVTFKDVTFSLFEDGSSRTEAVCPQDDTTSDVVPIAVGCALAGLVVVVLIAYLVGRRRSRQKGYQSV